MYNVGLYEVRKHFFQNQTHLTYNSNYHLCKTNENYKLLHSGMSQQTLKMVDRAFKSFQALSKLARQGKSDPKKVKIPNYLDKEGYFMLIIPQAKIEEDLSFYVPMSWAFKESSPERIKLQVPERLRGKSIKEIRILPKYNARYFEIEYVYEQEVFEDSFDPDTALAIDLGLNNLAACIDTKGASFIVDGRKLKSINQWYNKENARLQSIKDRQGIKKLTNRQAALLLKRNYRVKDYLTKAAKYIVDHCLIHAIGTLVVGCNQQQKQEINLGRKTNQQFVQIPHHLLRQKLQYYCQVYGIKYLEQEESYTSKASFIDGDEIPVWNPTNPQKHTFSGKRTKRGLYRTKNGSTINSDINGAANILVKSKQRLDNFQRLCRGLLENPLRITIS